MSETKGKLKSGSSAKAKKLSHPMWYLGPGGMPVEASSKKIPSGITAFCYVHDTEWTPIESKHHLSEGGPSQ